MATLERNLARRIAPTATGCWEWTGARNAEGYGMVREPVPGKPYGMVHRLVYEALVGPIPAGLVLDHLCRNTSCCNPGHLQPVTNRENTLRGTNQVAEQARRTSCVRGGHPLAGANLYVDKRGRRECRTCRREAQRRYELRRRP